MSPPSRRTSLNRVTLLRPGAPWHGQFAGRVLGVTALERLSPDTWVDALHHLLRTLTDPSPADRSARPDWDQSDWERWAQLDRIVLAGGLVAGDLGPRALQRLAGETDLPPVQIAPRAGLAPLVGLAARPRMERPALLLDLGHTAIKAALGTPAAAGTQAASSEAPEAPGATLTRVSRKPMPWRPFDVSTWPAPAAVLDLVRSAADRVARGDLANPRDAELEVQDVRVSIANYVLGGQLDADDTYGRLAELDPDPARLLARAVRPALGKDAHVSVLINDGQAAALPWSGQPRTAVITIGTSLGLGFPPPDEAGPQQVRSASRRPAGTGSLRSRP